MMQCPTMNDEQPEQPEKQHLKSEIARVLAAIETEYQAGIRGCSGYAEVGPHRQRTNHTENIKENIDALAALVGDEEEAVRLAAEALDRIDGGAPHASE